MRPLVYLLILVLSVVQADAAITVANRGSQNSATASTSIAVSPTATIVVGHMGVVLYAVDNVGTSGSTKVCPSTFNDTVGNTWTQRIDAIYNPAGAGSGVEIAAYTATITTQILTTDNVTITFLVSTSGRTVRLLDVAGTTGPYYVTSAPISDLLTSGQTGTAVSMTTGSIPTGDVVICWTGSESSTGTTTGDSDTTNGSWAANLSVTAVSAPMRNDVQWKIVTGTGTQSYDITLGASADWESGWLRLSETNPNPPAQSSTNGFF
jgi:hypothetical protein